jgi:MoaA/NifB/PqqE/SkfB family radical SAM enzyme
MSGLRLNQKNKYKALWEFAHNVAEVDTIPASLQIARSNVCNFQCVYCIDHRVGNQIPRTRNEGHTWDKLLQLVPRAEELGFHGISEFFIDPDFFGIIERCAAVGACLSLNTNASICTPKHLEALANYPGYFSISFSLDAATPETFLKIRGQDFWRIVGNIKTYIDRFESRRAMTWICLSFVITRSSVKDMMPFLFLAKALKADSVKYYRLHQYQGLDWKVETKDGGVFDYRKEYVIHCGEEYNRELERTRRAAEMLGILHELPAPLDERELREATR